ncbi:MAG: hypothetical protein P4L40_00695 [Terracidiphilus sp.]|nr:hypothetical protein [Terracidiphilus sp.]
MCLIPQTGTLSLGLQQECQQAALGALAEEVGVLTGVSIMCIACFFLVCKRVRNRMRGQQDEPNDFLYVELEDAADADALEELREFVMEHRVFPYSSIEDKEK